MENARPIKIPVVSLTKKNKMDIDIAVEAIILKIPEIGMDSFIIWFNLMKVKEHKIMAKIRNAAAIPDPANRYVRGMANTKKAKIEISITFL